MRHWPASIVTTLICVAASSSYAQQAAPPPQPVPIAAVLEDPAWGPSGDAEENLDQRNAPAATTEAQIPLFTPRRGRMPSVGSLFTDLKGDFRNTATTDNAIIMLSASASAALIHPYDQRISDSLSSSAAMDAFLGPGKIVGGFAVQFGGAWATYGIGRMLKNERAAIVGADLVRAQLVNTVFTQGLKLSINRTRPDGDPWSLPSGHASGTFANAAVLHRHFGWKIGAPAYAVATYVAASRVQDRRHFASDVIFGAGIGLISGRAVTVGRGGTRFAVSPMGLPGGGGITFTRIAN